jgi:hypothetical protein
MSFRIRSTTLWGRASLSLACLAVALLTFSFGAQKGPIKKLRLDPQAAQVELFEAEGAGLLGLRMVQKDAHQGNLFIENKSSQPLTVQLPQAIVGVHILKQLPPGGFFQQGNNANTGNANSNSGSGQGQPVGAGGANQNGVSGQSNGIGVNNGNNPFGNGIFSIPPEKVVQIPLKSVCLAYGKPDPQPRMTYQVVPLESYTPDPVLQELLKSFGTGSLDQMAVQAAAWHLADHLSWNEVAAKQIRHLGAVPVPYFNQAQIQAARKLVAAAEEQVRRRGDVKHAQVPSTPKKL